MRRLLLLATLLLGTCSDDEGHQPADAGALPPSSSALPRPTDLPRPPAGRLPRDLLPPGL
jgi:hypothetical protein